tara:strand:+ start:69 stop:566 length:498 start_codon:yes stop_codon:yes gene_type:complete
VEALIVVYNLFTNFQQGFGVMKTVFQTKWNCRQTWIASSKNTLWCLFGCSIGDLGTIAFFQFFQIFWNPFLIMSLAIVNGLITSIALETFILSRQMQFLSAFKTAIGMSFLSMVSMELAMNITDLLITGGAILTKEVIPIMLLAGFLTPLPYNYWRLKSLGRACH